MPKSRGKVKRRSKVNTDSSFSDSPSPDRCKDRMVPEDTFLDKLMKKADSLKNTFQFELAAEFYKRVLECDPSHLRAVESAAMVYLQLGDFEKAKVHLVQALRLSPESGFGKYFAMGQMHQAHESLDYFKKGIKVLESDVLAGSTVQSPLEGKDEGKKVDLSMAYCAMVELYMTDLCDEDDAESQCKGYIDSAIAADETNPEGYLCLASYHLVKEEHEDARIATTKSLSLWFPDYQKSRIEKTESCSLSYDARVNTSKVLIELSMFDEASEILDGLVEEDDEVVQVWYLSGLLNYLRGQDYYGNTRFYFKKALKLCTHWQVEFDNEDLIRQMNEMMSEMGPGSDDEDEDKENEENGNDENDDYETVSEEEEMDS